MLSLLQVSITADQATTMGRIHAETVVDPFSSLWCFISKSCISSPGLADKAVHQRMGIQRTSRSRETWLSHSHQNNLRLPNTMSLITQ